MTVVSLSNRSWRTNSTHLSWRRAVIVTVLVLCLAAVTAPAALVTKLGATDYALHAEGYEGGIIRLTARPEKHKVFEVVHALVAEPADDKAVLIECPNAAQCQVRFQDSLVDVEITKEDVVLHFNSGPQRLVEVKAGLDTLASPKAMFAFPAAKTLYGLAEHAADLPLRAGTTYEMYNTDAFQYPVNSSKALYGSIPFIMAYSAEATSGVLFLNAAEMNVKVVEDTTVPTCAWDAEVGVLDLFFLPGSTPKAVQRQHASLTGPTLLPPYFSLGFHQCRWNYLSTRDCLAIDEGFDRHDMPYDVLWLDVEHTDKKKYFTWDTYNFPDPSALVVALESKGRKLVTIKDPHVKVESGYFVHDEATKGNYYVLSSGGKAAYQASCWPGQSSWPDFLNQRTREWYAAYFHNDKYKHSSAIHTWVDMNEPSVFQGVKGTMAKDAIHRTDAGEQVEHRYLHNEYALLSIMSAYQGSLEVRTTKDTVERPFLLTRSFFPGSQRYAAMWNGDNMARWDHLENTFPELLSLALSNYAFSGADIGGFFFDTDEDLFVRWMQSGVFYPFMRAHAHLDTRRREPWTFSQVSQFHIRNALALRYALIPYLYTTFYNAHKTGDTVLRPLIYEFPTEENLREVQDTFLFGPSILVQPVVRQDVTSAVVPLPRGAVWYNYRTGEMLPFRSTSYTLAVEMDTIPIFLRGGHIVPMKLRLRRSTKATRHDPFTLYVALDEAGKSRGELFLDDGETFNYQKGEYVHRVFEYADGTLRNAAYPDTPVGAASMHVSEVERIVLLGYVGKPQTIRAVAAVASTVDVVDPGVQDGEDKALSIELEFERIGSSIIIRKPGVLVSQDWSIVIENE